jgi:hypothetical protein
LERDLLFLRENNIMDYSCLLGIRRIEYDDDDKCDNNNMNENSISEEFKKNKEEEMQFELKEDLFDTNSCIVFRNHNVCIRQNKSKINNKNNINTISSYVLQVTIKFFKNKLFYVEKQGNL